MGDSPKYLSSFCPTRVPFSKSKALILICLLCSCSLPHSRNQVREWKCRKGPNSPDAFSLQVKCTTQFLTGECFISSICLPARKVQAHILVQNQTPKEQDTGAISAAFCPTSLMFVIHVVFLPSLCSSCKLSL